MEQTSKLSIVVDTRNAQTQLRQFSTALKQVERDGINANKSLKNLTNGVDFTRLNAGLNGANANLIRFNNTAGQSASRMQNLGSVLNGLRSSLAGMASATNSINAVFGNLDRTMAQLAAATNRLSDASTRAAAQIQRLDNGLGGANARGRTFMGTLQGLQGLLMGGMFSIATLGIVKTADEMQNLNSQIKLVTKSEEEYLGIRQKVRELADKNFSDIKAATGLYSNSARALTNLGKSQADALKFTDAVSLAMRAGGRSAQEQASAILQLGQAVSSGQLLGDEFRSIAENAPILLELVSKRLGVLPGQLKGLASDGKITSEILFDALTQNVNILEEMAKKMPLTMAQAFTVAKNRYKTYVDDMMNQTGGMSGKIASMINGISGNFDTLAKVAIAGVGVAFLQMATTINVATKAMALFNLVTSANPLVLTLTTVVAVASAFYGLNDVLGVSSILFGDFFSLVNSGWVGIGDVVAKITGQTTKDVDNSNKNNTQSYLGFFKESEKGFTGFVQNIAGALATITATFRALFSYIENGMADALNAMGNGVINTFNWVSEQAAKIGIGNGSQTNKIPYRNVSARDAFSYYNTPLQAGIQSYFSGVSKRNDAKNSVPVPYAPSTDPMDEIKKSQFEQMKANDAIEEATKAAAKEAKERAKREKALNGGAKSSNRLVGISGDTGVGNAHLHIQYRDKSRPVSPADLARFKANGKALTDYKMTSGYGKRNTGIKGASTNHKGTDFGIPKNTPITTNIAVKSVKTWNDTKGGGYVSTITFEDGVVIDLLHQMPSVMGVEKGSSTGNKQIDSMVAKAEGNIASAAAKAERERIKAAEEAQREQERIAALDLKLLKEYGDKKLQLTLENDERVAEINESSFNSAKKKALIEESGRRMNQELSVYKKGLEDKVNELVKFQKTERDLLKKQYDDEVFSIVSDSELSRPENKAQLTQAIINAQLLNDYRVSLYEESLEQQKSAMYAFQKTERDVLIDSWDNKLADAELMYDELRDYRLEAIRIEGAQDINTFDTNQALKMLELKKYHMSEIAYIQARDALERKLIDLSNEPQEVKELQKDAMTQAANLKKSDALDSVMDEIKNESPMGRIEADYQRRLEIIDDYESQWTDLVGVHSAERTAIEQSYMDAKQQLMLGQSAAIFDGLAGMAKGFLGEQSGVYRALYATQKAYTFASALLSSKKAIMDAWSDTPGGYIAKAIAAGKVILSTSEITSAISGLSPKGFKQGGYTGNMGVNQAAGVVHGQEYVFDAQATKRIGVDNLNAMRSGKGTGETKVIVNNYSNEKANVQTTPDGDTIVTIGKIVSQMVDGKLSTWERNSKRQGHALYGMR